MAELNLTSEDCRLLFPMEDYFAIWGVYDETLYYYLSDIGFREYDLVTGETTDRGNPIPDGRWWASYDEQYIYLMGSNWDRLYILNRAYELLDEVSLPEEQTLYYVTQDVLFFGSHGWGAEMYLRKSLIGSGNPVLIPIEQVKP